GLVAQHRVDAARASILAAPDGAKSGADLRSQALNWLKAELDVLAKADDEMSRKILKSWLNDPEFGGVRNPDALMKLTEQERHAWEHFWTNVQKNANRN